IDKFVKTCQKFASELRVSMTEEFKQLGVWMDWDNPYETLRLDYMESAWWTISRAHERGLLIDADRVITWCPRCETALAEAEIEYWDESDPSIVVRMPVVGQDYSLLIWTTTPWTLPSNMAVAVHPDFDYVKVKLTNDEGSEVVIIAASQIEYIMEQGGYSEYEILEEMKGQDLEGLSYSPPFEIGDQMAKSEWVYKVVTADYVEADNTGLVHTAPGFGPDDYETGKRYGMKSFCPVGEDGRFTDGFPMMVGRKVRGVNDDVVEHLRENNRLFKFDRIMHRYGHCWRCKSPIIYRDTRQWFLDVPALKQDMLDEIDKSKWVPKWAGDSRQRNWVEGARQWCISRQRYWGIPMPIWECECGEKRVVGKYSELKEGKGYTEGMDTHRPWIDAVTFECPGCGKDMHRIEDVLDVWFDSGVASWAQLGYPGKDEEFEKWWPADFIVEAHDQTRGWFYSQLGAGVISFDKTPYKEVMMHGWILDPKGQKMSKSKGNVVEPLEIIEQLGADSLRLYLIKTNAPWEDMSFQKDGPRNARKMLNTYWNVVNFASTYMNLDGYDPELHTLKNVKDGLRDEDLWMLSRTENMKREVTEFMETRELQKVARSLEDYIMEDLSRWYVRLVRDRTWAEDDDSIKDKNASYFTLHYAIMNVAMTLAPIAPHISEEVYQHMCGTKLTVHMEDWPKCNDDLIDVEMEHSMSLIQNIVDLVASERSKVGSKLRWPLLGIYIRGNGEKTNDAVKVFDHVLAQQANIKNISYLSKDEVPEGDIEGVSFSEGDVFIDFSMTPEIESEGYARELIRRIQQMRKDMKLNVEQFINCDVRADPKIVNLLSSWVDHISGEVRANTLTFTDSPGGEEVKTWDVNGDDIIIGISSAE
ncbi:MAG TPA: isoleucine--tRNA ligase, partial [Candidatus Methanomethylophilaceae archaeon]|nr:isoleucine--tRNA ligase [Candidatus Methanomethylophilaceae archaeon]